MGLKAIEWTAFLCICAFGIQTSFSFIQNIREIEQNCARDGGYCINIIPPPLPRRRNNRRRGGAGRGAAGRMGTRTRKGSRPDPRALGAQHTRLPASNQPAAPTGAAPAYPPPRRQAPAYDPAAATGGQAPAYDPAAATGTQSPPQQNNGGMFFGSSSYDPYNSLFGMMMFTRKKRQVPEPHERKRLQNGQRLIPFLNQHCRKTEFDIGCRKEGGMCCLPPLNLK